MHDTDSGRLGALIAAIGSPAVARPAPDGDGTDAQRLATSQIDTLMRRVTALTAMLRERDDVEWDDIDQLTAVLLMSDLAAITSMTRALNGVCASRLAAALADLTAAGQDADRVLEI
jgi:hypothetical protein